MYFSIESRARIKEENPDLTFGEIAGKVGAAWKAVTDKTKWEENAREDKARYEKEMETYEPPDDLSDEDDAPTKKKGGKKAASSPKKKKLAKDPNAPKGAKGSYMFFSVEARPSIKEAYPDLNFAELAKKIGEDWKALEDKTKYEVLAREDKERAKREMEVYEKMKKEAMAMLSSSSSDSDDSDSSLSSDSDDEKMAAKKPQAKAESPVASPVKGDDKMVEDGDDGLGMISSGSDSDSD